MCRLQIIFSHTLAALCMLSGCYARSTRVSAQYTVADGSENSQRTYGRGIVEDAAVEDGGILTTYNARPIRV